MSDDWGISPDDLDEIAGTADEVLRHEDRIYVIHHQLTGMQAIEWVETYENAIDGDVTAMRHILGFLHDFATRLMEMMDIDDEEVDDYNSIHAADIERVLGTLFDVDDDEDD